ncbi:MAG: hydroxysqualene dehydroxylase HpnE [Caulobacteraceae bacterium]
MRSAIIIGAGLSGLSAAAALAQAGAEVEINEAAHQPGGRCRSWFDPVLERVIDNGNHLLLSGNRAAKAYLARIGAADRVTGPAQAAIPFFDLREALRWTIRPTRGPLPFWLLDPLRRTPGASLSDHIAFVRLALAHGERTIGQTVASRGILWERLIRPFLLAALNTEPELGSAALAGAVIRESLAKGAAACAPRIASPTLSAAFIDPALAFLGARGAKVRLGDRVRAIGFEGGRAAVLATSAGDQDCSERAVVLAVPPWIATSLLPGLEAPNAFNAIVNGHFACAPPPGAPAILGLIGGTAEWVFAFPDRLSVTVSGAGAIVDADRGELAKLFWSDISKALGMQSQMPQFQIVKERRATFAATPDQNARRPGPRTGLPNLILAGDWTATGLPATIEGAIRSGETAARLALE